MEPYSKLLKKHEDASVITYQELLSTQEWSMKRARIIQRDSSRCTECGKNATFYVSGVGNFWLRKSHMKDFGLFKKGNSFEEREINWVETFVEESDKARHLQVHHSYYILSKLPWEYPDEDLITLCNWCHLNFHKEHKVPVYIDDRKRQALRVDFCPRCYGAGWFPQYKHIEKGVCFECRGTRFSI